MNNETIKNTVLNLLLFGLSSHAEFGSYKKC